MVIKGTEYYDAPSKRYVDFPITDVLQVRVYLCVPAAAVPQCYAVSVTPGLFKAQDRLGSPVTSDGCLLVCCSRLLQGEHCPGLMCHTVWLRCLACSAAAVLLICTCVFWCR